MSLGCILIKLLVNKSFFKTNILLRIKDSSLKAVINKRINTRNRLLSINSNFFTEFMMKSLIF